LEKIAAQALDDQELASELRRREDIDWQGVAAEVGAAGQRVLERLALTSGGISPDRVKTASGVAYARMKNRAGFNAQEWRLAWNQVKALNDRQQLDTRALARFARFG